MTQQQIPHHYAVQGWHNHPLECTRRPGACCQPPDDLWLTLHSFSDRYNLPREMLTPSNTFTCVYLTCIVQVFVEYFVVSSHIHTNTHIVMYLKSIKTVFVRISDRTRQSADDTCSSMKYLTNTHKYTRIRVYQQNTHKYSQIRANTRLILY